VDTVFLAFKVTKRLDELYKLAITLSAQSDGKNIIEGEREGGHSEPFLSIPTFEKVSWR
jgi:hypothetical protein